MMKGTVFCVLIVLLCPVFLDLVSSAPLVQPIDSSSKCRDRYGYKFFYDHGTEHCEKCREICQNAELTGTVRQCNQECQPYLDAVKCGQQKDRYYDEAVDKCSSCSALCDTHQITGTTRQCREVCKDYMDKLTPKQVPSLHKQNYLKAMDGSDAAQDSGTADLLVHPGWIAAMVVGGVALVCVLVVVGVFYWTCKQQQQQQQQYGPAPREDKPEEEGVEVVEEGPEEQRRLNQSEGHERSRSRRPVEETSQGSSGSQHFAIDGAQPVPSHFAFSDLPQTQRNHSDCV